MDSPSDPGPFPADNAPRLLTSIQSESSFRQWGTYLIDFDSIWESETQLRWVSVERSSEKTFVLPSHDLMSQDSAILKSSFAQVASPPETFTRSPKQGNYRS